jgi:hypothetical protein
MHDGTTTGSPLVPDHISTLCEDASVGVRDDLRAEVREVLGPAARSHGFKGTSPTWRRSTPSGDWAIVNLQSARSSSASSVRCVLNTSVAPEPWLRWTRVQMGAAMPKAIPESMGLYKQRLLPSNTPDGNEGWWQVDSLRRVPQVVDDMQAQLERQGWPVLCRLLERDEMLDRVRQGDLGFWRKENVPGYFATAEALLLMDAGPSRALDEQLALVRATSTAAQVESADRFVRWVRQQAESAT